MPILICNPREEKLLRGFNEQRRVEGNAILKPSGILIVEWAGTETVTLEETSYPGDEGEARKGKIKSGIMGTT